jgi:hypothetical protein
MTKNFRAVEIVASLHCCAAVKALRGQRKFCAEAPRLPLTDCTTPGECRCRFEKYPDRRDGDDRRPFALSMRGAWYGGIERRRSSARRSSDV